MKTKTIITAIFFTSIAYSSFAQSEMKKENGFGLSITMNSIQGQIAIPLMTNGGEVVVDADGNIIAKGDRNDYSISCSILPKYYINDDIVLRFEFGITNLNLKAHYEVEDVTSSARDIYNAEVGNKIYRYAPGFQWIFMRKKRIESYCGMTISYCNYKSLKHHYYAEKTNLTTNTLQVSNDVTRITPGGLSAGVGAFAGFSIYLFKRVSIGAELSSSALYYKLGGEATQTYIEFNVSGPNPAATYNTTYPNSYKGFKISKITSSFNISFWI